MVVVDRFLKYQGRGISHEEGEMKLVLYLDTPFELVLTIPMPVIHFLFFCRVWGEKNTFCMKNTPHGLSLFLSTSYFVNTNSDPRRKTDNRYSGT